MNGLIYAHPKIRPTGKKIAQYLGADLYSQLRTARKYDYIFRYGHSGYINNEPSIIINTSNSIQNSSNKSLMKQIFNDNDIPIPKQYTLETLKEKSLPVLARPRSYSKGQDFHVIYGIDEAIYFLNKGYALQSFIGRDKNEYRIFVFNNRIFETNIKKPQENINYHPYIRNFDHGWQIIPINRSLVPKGIQAISKRATEALGLVWSAVDICFTYNDEKIFVYEANSAPGLYERKAEKLAEFVNEYINS